MDKLDRKSQKLLIDAMERAREHQLQHELKREEKLWKQVEAPYRLIDTLPMLTKYELDDIRKQLELNGMSSLKKAELAVELSLAIPARLVRILSTFDRERYDLLEKIINNRGILPVDDDFPSYKIVSLRDNGIVFPILKDRQKHLMVPVDVIDQFANIDHGKLQVQIRQNTEWIHLVHGMIYYYGVMPTSKMLEKIEGFSKDKVDIRKYFDVIAAAEDYYQQIRILPYYSGGYIANDVILNAEGLIKKHKERADIEYYPFTKNQLMKAGEPGFIEKSSEMMMVLRFLSESYDLTAEDKDEIADQIFYMINMDAQPGKLIEYLQSILELPSFEFLQQLTAFVIEAYNNTRMWTLKGYTPTELRKEREKHLKPKPVHPLSQESSNVIDLDTRRKIGRNDPCSCGSGKKYKKCCGK
jgi:uncharacterized protein YecA (UPF0149 family)